MNSIFGNRRNRGAGQRQQSRPRRDPRNEISYADALSTLQSMFSGVDVEVIRMVLDSNGGRMESTVENLLQMTGGGGAAAAPAAAAPKGYVPPAVPASGDAAAASKPPAAAATSKPTGTMSLS